MKTLCASVALLAALVGAAPALADTSNPFENAAPAVPQFGSFTTGTYAPTNYGGSAQPCISRAAPPVPYGSTLASLDGLDPNGDWSLYVVDDCAGSAGLIAQGWSLSLDSAPTAVTVVSFAARRQAGSVELNWRTASEAGLLGFEVWRSSGKGAVKVKTVLVSFHRPSGVRGASYRVVDGTARPGVRHTYRLRVIERNGARRWASIARVSL
ncbi:MAG: hypothetical protein ABR521_10465 [Gaiellaceae bacterium]